MRTFDPVLSRTGRKGSGRPRLVWEVVVAADRSVVGVPRSAGTGGSPWLMLALATLGFAVNFWAWALLSPLGPRFKESLDLTSSQ